MGDVVDLRTRLPVTDEPAPPLRRADHTASARTGCGGCRSAGAGSARRGGRLAGDSDADGVILTASRWAAD